MSKLGVKRGIQADYNALSSYDSDSLYFCTDTGRMFLGDAEYCNNLNVSTTSESGYYPIPFLTPDLTTSGPVEMYINTENLLRFNPSWCGLLVGREAEEDESYGIGSVKAYGYVEAERYFHTDGYVHAGTYVYGAQKVFDGLGNVLSEKQDIEDDDLTTTSKTIVGAINELNDDIDELNTDIYELNDDIDELNTDIYELNADIDVLNADINELNADIDDISIGTENLLSNSGDLPSGYTTDGSNTYFSWEVLDETLFGNKICRLTGKSIGNPGFKRNTVSLVAGKTYTFTSWFRFNEDTSESNRPRMVFYQSATQSSTGTAKTWVQGYLSAEQSDGEWQAMQITLECTESGSYTLINYASQVTGLVTDICSQMLVEGSKSVTVWTDKQEDIINIINNKQDIEDDDLETTSKTIVGAINELNTAFGDIDIPEISDNYTSSSGNASDGVVASSYAVYNAYRYSLLTSNSTNTNYNLIFGSGSSLYYDSGATFNPSTNVMSGVNFSTTRLSSNIPVGFPILLGTGQASTSTKINLPSSSSGYGDLYWYNNKLYSTGFVGNLTGNADTATTATKLGSSDVGSGIKPIYLSSGVATASSSDVGDSDSPIYMSNGVFNSCGEFQRPGFYELNWDIDQSGYEIFAEDNVLVRVINNQNISTVIIWVPQDFIEGEHSCIIEFELINFTNPSFSLEVHSIDGGNVDYTQIYYSGSWDNNNSKVMVCVVGDKVVFKNFN